MNAKQVKKYFILADNAKALLQKSFNQLGLSGRFLDRILKIFRTIADLEKSELIKVAHLGEAMNYWVLDKKMWRGV